MARRRMISEDMISDERFNRVSLEAQNVFLRMLAVSDDCGVVPAGSYRLNVLVNTPPKLQGRIREILEEIVSAGLGFIFRHREEEFFAFKPESFQAYQSYILNKATKSEYLRMSKAEFVDASKNFLEIPRTSGRVDDETSCAVESRKQKVESREIRKSELDSVAAEIYELHAQRIRAGARADAIRSITALLRDGVSPAVLRAAVERYAGNGMPSDKQFRIQANNFFGQKARWRDYANDSAAPGVHDALAGLSNSDMTRKALEGSLTPEQKAEILRRKL